jgi:hypothetical protein
LYVYGVQRGRAFHGPRGESIPGLTRVRYRELEALVRPVPFSLPEPDDSALRQHQRVVEGAMRRGTVLPFPFAVVFRERRDLIRFLEEQYLAIEEALSFFEGRFEVRLHVGVRDVDPVPPELRELAAHVYAELRRIAHAAQPMPPRDGRIMSAAFLVARGGWVEFVEHGEDLAAADPRLTLDVTGPWPAYDFVRLVR